MPNTCSHIPHMFDHWADPVVHLLLQKNFMDTAMEFEMNNWIGPTVKQLWNYAIHVLHKFGGLNIIMFV